MRMSQLKTEGKSPHKKGTKKYNAHMAAMHAESTEEKRWKQTSMSPEEAIAKYGKENVKVKKGALRNGDDMVEVFVESVDTELNEVLLANNSVIVVTKVVHKLIFPAEI